MHRVVYRKNIVRILSVVFYLALPAYLVHAALHTDRNSGEAWLAAAGWLLFWLLPLIWILRTRLELSEEGLLLSEGVFTLRTSWQNVSALDLTPGAEGVVLHQPLPDKPARRLQRWALANQLAPSGALKGGYQRHRWIDRGVFIPLQVFGRVVHSAEFHRQLQTRLPTLEILTPEKLAAIEETEQRARNIWTFN